ncbi:hypothetical protein ABK040_003136 [Willaertia magna]
MPARSVNSNNNNNNSNSLVDDKVSNEATSNQLIDSLTSNQNSNKTTLSAFLLDNLASGQFKVVKQDKEAATKKRNDFLMYVQGLVLGCLRQKMTLQEMQDKYKHRIDPRAIGHVFVLLERKNPEQFNRYYKAVEERKLRQKQQQLAFDSTTISSGALSNSNNNNNNVDLPSPSNFNISSNIETQSNKTNNKNI